MLVDQLADLPHAGGADPALDLVHVDHLFEIVLFLSLAPGMYKVTVALTGFSTIVRDEVEVRVGQTVNLPFNLKVATVEETVVQTGQSLP